jgi:hypothetical protein
MTFFEWIILVIVLLVIAYLITYEIGNRLTAITKERDLALNDIGNEIEDLKQEIRELRLDIKTGTEEYGE